MAKRTRKPKGKTDPKKTKLNKLQVTTAQLLAARDTIINKSIMLAARQVRIAELATKNAELEARIAELEPMVFAAEKAGIAAGNAESTEAVGLPVSFNMIQTDEGCFLDE